MAKHSDIKKEPIRKVLVSDRNLLLLSVLLNFLMVLLILRR